MRSGMKQSLEETRQQKAAFIAEQRERMKEIARQRDELRKQHAAHGKEMRDRNYGNNAASVQRSALQAEKVEQRKELDRKIAQLEAERNVRS